MLRAAAAASMRTGDSRGTPAVMHIGRDRQPMMPVSLGQGAMWPVGRAPTLPNGQARGHSATKRGRTALLSGECRIICLRQSTSYVGEQGSDLLPLDSAPIVNSPQPSLDRTIKAELIDGSEEGSDD